MSTVAAAAGAGGDDDDDDDDDVWKQRSVLLPSVAAAAAAAAANSPGATLQAETRTLISTGHVRRNLDQITHAAELGVSSLYCTLLCIPHSRRQLIDFLL